MSVQVDKKNAPRLYPSQSDQNRDVERWFHDLEYLFLLHRIRDCDKFLLTVRLLAGTAASVAKTFRFTTYTGLKPQESAMHYLMDMQRVARQAAVPESELLTTIIDGLGNPSLTAVLRYMVHTMADLREKLKCFEASRRLWAIKPPSADVRASPVRLQETPRSPPKPIRCFNCSHFGHHVSECKKPID